MERSGSGRAGKGIKMKKVYDGWQAREAVKELLMVSDENDRTFTLQDFNLKKGTFEVNVKYHDGTDDLHKGDETGLPLKEMNLLCHFTHYMDEDEEGYVIPVITEIDWNGLPVPDEFHQEVFMKIESALEELAEEMQENKER